MLVCVLEDPVCAVRVAGKINKCAYNAVCNSGFIRKIGIVVVAGKVKPCKSDSSGEGVVFFRRKSALKNKMLVESGFNPGNLIPIKLGEVPFDKKISDVIIGVDIIFLSIGTFSGGMS